LVIRIGELRSGGTADCEIANRDHPALYTTAASSPNPDSRVLEYLDVHSARLACCASPDRDRTYTYNWLEGWVAVHPATPTSALTPTIPVTATPITDLPDTRRRTIRGHRHIDVRTPHAHARPEGLRVHTTQSARWSYQPGSGSVGIRFDSSMVRCSAPLPSGLDYEYEIRMRFASAAASAIERFRELSDSVSDSRLPTTIDRKSPIRARAPLLKTPRWGSWYRPACRVVCDLACPYLTCAALRYPEVLRAFCSTGFLLPSSSRKRGLGGAGSARAREDVQTLDLDRDLAERMILGSRAGRRWCPLSTSRSMGSVCLSFRLALDNSRTRPRPHLSHSLRCERNKPRGGSRDSIV
jgi:hypothetical protein